MIVIKSSLDSFREFYDAEVDGLVRHAALILRSDTDANDVVHDAFVAAYRRWSEINEPRPYLYRSVMNGCRNRYRSNNRERDAIRRIDTIHPADEHHVLWDVLAELPINERSAVVLRFYGGFSQAEIAEHLDCPQGSVGPWIRRALNRMKEQLDD